MTSVNDIEKDWLKIAYKYFPFPDRHLEAFTTEVRAPLQQEIADIRAYAEQRDKRVAELEAALEAAGVRLELAMMPKEQRLALLQGSNRAEFEEGKRLAHEQACGVTHALMAERDALKADVSKWMALAQAHETANGIERRREQRMAQVSQPVGAVVAKPTDMGRRLRHQADNGLVANAAMCRAAADEIDRYYTGMCNWKATAEAKDSALAAQTAAPGVRPDAYMFIIKGDGIRTELAAIDYFPRSAETIVSKRPLYFAAPAAPLDISGLTAYEVCELSQSNIVYLASDIQALIDAQKGKQ